MLLSEFPVMFNSVQRNRLSLLCDGDLPELATTVLCNQCGFGSVHCWFTGAVEKRQVTHGRKLLEHEGLSGLPSQLRHKLYQHILSAFVSFIGA